MKHLIGIREFKQKKFPGHAELFARLAGGQNPWALVIACSDSRYTAEMVMNADPGDLFVVRNAGNQVLRYTIAHPSDSASGIEYALNFLKVNHVFVLGHYGCGVVQAALSRPAALEANKAVCCWVDHTRHDVVGNWDSLPVDEQVRLWREGCRQNVVHQIGNLDSHPSFQARAKEIRVHGLIFDILPGNVEEYEKETGQWSVIGPAEEIPAA
ncbi:MAG: hypothetical protein K2X93_18235 [Candidatus Obscuribacterales bacterium]|nr:hypothetical protein [Candidatus Obscuribacterales bacterium]